MTNRQASLRREGKLVLSMVGLPARGKTAIARRLKRHLTWAGYRTEIFNVGNYRRRFLGASQPAAFFDPANQEAVAARHEMARLGAWTTKLPAAATDAVLVLSLGFVHLLSPCFALFYLSALFLQRWRT